MSEIRLHHQRFLSVFRQSDPDLYLCTWQRPEIIPVDLSHLTWELNNPFGKNRLIGKQTFLVGIDFTEIMRVIVIIIFGKILEIDMNGVCFINFIMTTNTSNFRLQRLTKTVGIRDKSHSDYEPKQTFKLAALNSIGRGVKYNDLSYLSGRDLNKLRKEPEVGEDIQYESAHSNLSQIRKNYDSVHKDKTKRDDSISKLKEQKNKLTIIEGQLLSNKEGGRKKVTDLKNNLQKISLLHTESDMQKKVLLSMRQRLKTDKVVYDQRKFDMEKQLRFLKKQQQVIVLDRTEISESDDRTNKVYKKYLQQLRAEQAEREEHLASLEAMIEERGRLNNFNMLRSQEMTEIAERAMQDKDENQLKWEKLYMTNKFVAKLLRDKMDKEMEKFFVVESAFKTIKISTGVSDTETLIHKFLNKETAYGDLLGKIAENQRRIEELKREKQEFLHEGKELETEREIIDSTKRVQINLEGPLKNMGEMQEKEKKIILERNNLRNWISKSAKKLNTVLGKQVPINIERDSKAICAGFIEYIKCINAQLDEIQKEEDIKKDSFSDKDKLKLNNKILRIKPVENVFEQSDEEGADTEETDLIGNQRNEIIRNNEKFMKEVKMKHQEKRKQQAEAASPKKKAEPEKPKAPEHD